jgi:hypothetical protein
LEADAEEEVDEAEEVVDAVAAACNEENLDTDKIDEASMEVFDVENDAQSVCTFSECVPLGSPKLLP